MNRMKEIFINTLVNLRLRHFQFHSIEDGSYRWKGTEFIRVCRRVGRVLEQERVDSRMGVHMLLTAAAHIAPTSVADEIRAIMRRHFRVVHGEDDHAINEKLEQSRVTRYGKKAAQVISLPTKRAKE